MVTTERGPISVEDEQAITEMMQNMERARSVIPGLSPPLTREQATDYYLAFKAYDTRYRAAADAYDAAFAKNRP